jgi:hypothetical protein
MRGSTSTAMTRPVGPTRRAISRVKKPIPGPGSSTVIPVRTYDDRMRAESCRRLRIGLARKSPTHQGHRLCSHMPTNSDGAPNGGFPLHDIQHLGIVLPTQLVASTNHFFEVFADDTNWRISAATHLLTRRSRLPLNPQRRKLLERRTAPLMQSR